jgi:hypothetical protein
MDSVDRNLILTPAADKIRDYCYELGHQLGLKLECVYWGVDKAPRCPNAPYKLTVKMGPQEFPWFWFTRDEIAGYVTGTSTVSVQDRIRTGLKAHFQG